MFLSHLKFSMIVMCFSCLLAHARAQDINLDMAVYRTLMRSPSLHIAHEETQARRYQVKQARLYPNPSFSYELENFAGNHKWSGWDNREEYYIYEQLFETAGKRRLRTEAASNQYYAALVGYDISKLVVLNRLSRAFVNTAAAQELLKLAYDQAEVAKEVLSMTTKRVEAGKISLSHQNKAEVAYFNAVTDIERAQADLNNAKRRLALIWAQPCPDFERVIFPLFDIASPLSFEQCLADLCNQAEVVQSCYTYLTAKNNWRLEKANRMPDVTLEVGYKANYEENNQGLIAGISIPLPLFDQNQGNIGRAYFDMLKTGDQGRQLWLILENKLAISYEELVRAYEEAERLKNLSLSSATQAFELTQKGYREGKLDYLDVLDAQRTLFEVRERYIQVLVNYHSRLADINYLNSQTE